MPLIITLLYSLVIILLFLGAILLHKNKRNSDSDKALLLFFFSTICGTASMYLGYFFATMNHTYSLWAIRGTFAFAILMVYSLLSLAYYYPRITFKCPVWCRRMFDVLTVFTVIASFTKFIYEGTFLINGEIEDLHGILHGFYLMQYWTYAILAVLIFIKKTFILEGIDRKKMILVASAGIIFSFVVSLVYTILPRFDIYLFHREAILLSGLFAIVVLYAMMKYRFLNVKVTLGKISRVLFASLFTGVFIYLEYRLLRICGIEMHSIYEDIIFVISGIWIFRFFYNHLIPIIFHKIFGLTDLDHFRRVMKKVKDDMRIPTSIDDFEKFLSDDLTEIHIDYVKVVLVNGKGNKAKKVPHVGYAENHQEILIKSEIPYLKHRNRWFTSDTVDQDVVDKGEVCIPLYTSSSELFAFVILGKKRFDDLYTVEEVAVLERMRHHLQLKVLGILYREQLHTEVANKTRELRKRNEEMAYVNQKLEKLDEAKNQFLSIASHELRTPMTVINGFTDLLLNKRFGDLTEKQESFLKIIAENSFELRGFVHKMLDVTQLEADKMMFEVEKVDLKDFLEKLVEEYQVIVEKKDIDLTFEMEQDLNTEIEIDPRRLKEIIGNLIANAYKFTDEQGKITVKLNMCAEADNCFPDNSSVRIIVEDNGMGIAEEDMENIFDRFHQTIRSRKKAHSGSGLGLSIVKLLLDKFGGKIKVESEVGSGSKFCVCLPLECAVENKSNVIKV